MAEGVRLNIKTDMDTIGRNEIFLKLRPIYISHEINCFSYLFSSISIFFFFYNHILNGATLCNYKTIFGLLLLGKVARGGKKLIQFATGMTIAPNGHGPVYKTILSLSHAARLQSSPKGMR